MESTLFHEARTGAIDPKRARELLELVIVTGETHLFETSKYFLLFPNHILFLANRVCIVCGEFLFRYEIFNGWVAVPSF